MALLAGCASPAGRQAEANAAETSDPTETSDTAEGGTGSGKLPLPGRKVNYDFAIDAPKALIDEIQRQTLVGRWQRRQDYDPIQFEGLVARLRDEVVAILQSDGYFRAVVTVEARPRRVSVEVRPGPQARVADVALRVSGPAAADPQVMGRPQLQSIPQLERGQPFRASAWQDGKREILDALNRQGYLRAEVSESEARVDVAGGTVALDLTVASGARLAFGELTVEGLQRYDRKIIEDLRPFVAGEPYSDEKLQTFQMRLRGAGYFSSVSALPDLIGLQADPAAEQVRIQVVVAELTRRRVVFGLGYSTDEGPRGQVGFEHRDLFGANLQLESALVVSAKQQRAFANFRTPYDENNRFIGFGQRVEREDIENLATLRSNTYGGVGKREGDIESFTSLQYQIERERIAGSADTPEERNSQRALVLGKAWTLRRLDSTLAPQDGYAVSVQLSGARAGVMTDRSFVRFHTRATRFQPLADSGFFKDGTLVGLLELGVVGASSREDIPSENLFRTGGVQSIRGYAYRSLGLKRGDAVVGGRYLALTSLEYQHRITNEYAAAVFVDYGNATDSRRDFDPVAGYGVGLRWRTPIGPVNLDVAYGQAVSRYRVHFSIGYTF
ncbi:MAG: outer membrane protein assembly factor [Lautropia sp.]|nr:outer membrane protein assembly factor [Lautropia sp.]